MINGKTYYELFIKKHKNIRKLPFRVHPKGAVLLKEERSSSFIEYAKLSGKDKITVMDTKLKSIGSIDALRVNFKGKMGYVALNRIIAPTFYGRVKNWFAKPVKQPDERINKLNTELTAMHREVDTVRSAAGVSTLAGLECKFKNTTLKDIAFAYDVPLTRDSIADIALGPSNIDLPYWIATPPEGDDLSKFFENADSFPVHEPHLQDILNDVFDRYVDKEEGGYKLQSSLYKILTGSDRKEKDFFMKAISGPDGNVSTDIADGNKFNVTIFTGGDIKLTLTQKFYGQAKLEFADPVLFKTDFLALLAAKKTCLVIENTIGVSSFKMRGKTVRNCSIGLYKTSYIRRLRDAIQFN